MDQMVRRNNNMGTLIKPNNVILSRLPLEGGGEMIWHDKTISSVVGRSKAYGDVKNNEGIVKH